MKFIHTSDWHLGHSLYGYDRIDEQRRMLDDIVALCRRHLPDALLVSGDVFDSPQPSAAAQKLLTDCMVKLRRECPDMKIIITAGNHDSASRHEVHSSLWALAGVDMIGSWQLPDEGAKNLIELPGKGFVLAIPYVNSRFMPDGFFATMLESVGRINTASLPVVMMAHIAVSGSDTRGHDTDEEEKIIGNIEAVPLQAIGEGYDYLALGHIHRAQKVPGSQGNVCARYSGAPIPVGFDEDYCHSVALVEVAGHGGSVSVELLPVDALRPLITIPSKGSVTWNEAIGMLAAFPDDEEAYIRLNVTYGADIPADCRGVAVQTCAGKKCRFCIVNMCRPERDAGSGSLSKLSFGELRQASPSDIARRYAEAAGEIFDDTLAEMLAVAIANVEQEKREQ